MLSLCAGGREGCRAPRQGQIKIALIEVYFNKNICE